MGVVRLQQLTSLLPAYRDGLESMFGPHGIRDVRRAWGMAADLVSAMTGLPATIESLCAVGLVDVIDVGHLVYYEGALALDGSRALHRPDLRRATPGDLHAVLRVALAHDAVAKPLLRSLREELRSYDAEATGDAGTGTGPESFQALMRNLVDRPRSFPNWDGRPMFLDEQKGFLDYLAKAAGVEVVAAALVDEALGAYLLRIGGVLKTSEVSGEAVFDVAAGLQYLGDRPVGIVCHQVGDAVLAGLASLRKTATAAETLIVVGQIVSMAVGIDLDPGFSRALEDEAKNGSAGKTFDSQSFDNLVLDLREVKDESRPRRVRPFPSPVPFNFPELESD